jgi:hypothetical protein
MCEIILGLRGRWSGSAGESLATRACAHLDVSTSIWWAADRVPGLRVTPRPRASGPIWLGVNR